MKVKIENWSLTKVISNEIKIDPKPQYQRGNVWSKKDNQLLIDSILKGFDIPKIYLRKIKGNDLYEYEVADGQQRLFAIWEFSKNEFNIDEIQIGDNEYEALKYSDISSKKEFKKLKETFNSFELTISVLEDATENEVRTLFARLQMGKSLNEPEKRNAIGSSIGYAIDLEVKTAPFFVKSKIPESRFNRQDFLAHVLTLICFENSNDLKAELIKKMYEKYYVKYPLKHMKTTHKILLWINEINQLCNKRIKNKWAFVDFFWLLFRHFEAIDNIDFKKMAIAFNEFENKRLLYSKTPEKLLDTDDSKLFDKPMYEYIIAFNFSGNLVANIDKRAQTFDKKFLKFINFK